MEQDSNEPPQQGGKDGAALKDIIFVCACVRVCFESVLIMLCSSPDRMQADCETQKSVPTVRWGFPWQRERREDTGLPSLSPSLPPSLSLCLKGDKGLYSH